MQFLAKGLMTADIWWLHVLRHAVQQICGAGLSVAAL